MANTIMTAKNSFELGLIMDLSPDNTSANSLTSALNATLVTFNGNEMLLQNDMGNGRVETARLPDGYIPMGTCEFGDIIYIVSYNPLIDKALIGCFPSPERNIASTEISPITQALTSADFLNFDGSGPTGELRTTSVKKVLIESKKLNPGDKYIIYTNSADELTNNKDCLSDFGASDHGETHKYVKLHVVSIDDSGKITYLDTTTKWYNVNGYNYYVNKSKIKTSLQSTDLDEYRNLTESNWSIFSSKHSGKLAILAELEIIDTFSCSYTLDFVSTFESSDIKYKQYKLSLCPEYLTQGRKLPYVCITKASFNNTDLKDNNGNKLTLNDYLVYYHNAKYGSSEYPGETQYPIYDATTITKNANVVYDVTDYEDGGKTKFNDIEIGIVTIPFQQKIKDTWVNILSSSFIYNIEVTPAMEFGRLDYLAVSLSIDFNKVGTGDVAITDWKYHNSGTTAILSYGIDAYPKPNYKVDSIIIQFFDNNGFVGEYKLEDKKSYSGIFTEYLGLDGESINSRFSRYNSIKKEIGKHIGSEVESNANNVGDDYYDTSHLNDAGTLYSNFLYGARIIINQSKIKGEPKSESKSYYRWFWTTSMFNEYYYQIRDFDILDFELILNGEVLYESDPSTFVWKSLEINNLGNDFSESDLTHYNTYSANVLYIGKEPNKIKQSNVNMYVRAGLQEDYGCFNLFKDRLSDINLEVYLSTGKILYSLDGDYQYLFSDKEMNVTDSAYLSVLNIIKTDGDGTEGFKYLEGTALNSAKIDTENTIKDDFNITFSDFYSTTEKTIDLIKQEGKGMITLVDDENNNTKCQVWAGTLNDCYFSSHNDKKGIPLTLIATLLNKAYAQNVYEGTVKVPVYLPIIDNADELKEIGITYLESSGGLTLGFNKALYLSHINKTFGAGNLLIDNNTLHFISAIRDEEDYDDTDNSKNFLDGKTTMISTSENLDFINVVWSDLNNQMPQFFPVYIGGNSSTGQYSVLNGNNPKNYADISSWQAGNNYNAYTSKTTHRLTGKAFNTTSSGTLEGIRSDNSVMFVGMKYKEGFTLFNTATTDTFTEDNHFKQVRNSFGEGKYYNFAYLLYLIFSNLYHKNKRAEDKQINIRNFVRNGDYDIQLQKNIIIKLEPKDLGEGNKHNILLRGMDFNVFSTDIITKLLEVDKNCNISSKNITLKFLNYAHNSLLLVNVNSEPMSFLNTDADAYLLRNGALIGTQELGNQFYIWLNNQLEVFQNKVFLFDANDVKQNLKYLLNDKLSGNDFELQGVKVEHHTKENADEKAHNKYIQYISEYIWEFGMNFPYTEFANVDEARAFMLEKCSELYYNYLPESVEILEEDSTTKTYYRSEIIKVLYEEGKLYNTNPINLNYELSLNYITLPVFFITEQSSSNPSIIWGNSFRVHTNPDFINWNTKHHDEYDTFYKLDQYLNMNLCFKYNNRLELDSSVSHSTFGIKDSGKNYSQGYCDFLQDVILDKKCQVLR